MLGAFFDDSGTHDGSPVVAMGGLLGTNRQWDEFEKRWVALLKDPVPGKPPLEQFHLAPCRNAWDQFASYNLAERDRATYLFRKVILDIGFVTVAVAADTAAWKELVFEPDVIEHLGTPLEFCFFKCVETVTGLIRGHKPGEPIDIYFDLGTEPQLNQLAEMFRQVKRELPEIERVGFLPVKSTVALQGADMIAYETYLYGVESLRNPDNPVPNPHFEEYVSRPLSVGLFARREHIEQFVSRAKGTVTKQRGRT